MTDEVEFEERSGTIAPEDDEVEIDEAHQGDPPEFDDEEPKEGTS